jgi:hypothetical protein
VRRTWWVAALFLLPALFLTLLVHAAFSLQRGLGSPTIWAGLLIVPLVGTAGAPGRAAVRGFYAIAALCLLFAAVVYLRIWTDAGRQVLAREGLDRLALASLGLGLVSGFAARRGSRGPAGPDRRPAAPDGRAPGA